MKVLGISDTHNMHAILGEEIQFNLNQPPGEEYDMIVHSGDISRRGDPHEVESFLKWYHELENVKHKVFILGNHEVGMVGNEDWIRERIQKDYPSLTFLHHEHITIDGIKIFGSPYTPYFRNWAYNVPRDLIKHYWDEIELHTDIIVTHGPPFGIGDLAIRNNEITGCRHLLNRIEEIKPQIHQFGHIHEGAGKYRIQDGIPTFFVNASCLNERYIPLNHGIKYYVEEPDEDC